MEGKGVIKHHVYARFFFFFFGGETKSIIFNKLDTMGPKAVADYGWVYVILCERCFLELFYPFVAYIVSKAA